MAEKLCTTCGTIGYGELVVTCSKCKVISEHRYCMRKKPDDLEFWLCEECVLDEAKTPDELRFQAQPRTQRLAETGKVKFMSTEEVIKLSSGVMKEFSAKPNMARKIPSNSMPRQLFHATKASRERSFSLMPAKECGVKKQQLAFRVPPPTAQTCKKVKVTDKPTCASSVSRPGLPVILTGKRAPLASIKLQDRPKNVKNKVSFVPQLTSSQRNIETASKDVEMAKNKSSSAPLLPTYPPQNNGIGGRNYAVAEGQNYHDEERDMQNVISKMNMYRCYCPALHASWRGGFLFNNTLTAGKFYGGFLAKPPCKVHRRAYEIFKQMPQILHVKPLTRSYIWDDLFHNESPDLGDIALYFFPSDNVERSRRNNSCLFELMERENLLIRSFINGAELLIFTAKQLDVDSQDVISRSNPECLLLGIFRPSKNDQSIPNIVGEWPDALPPPPMDCSSTAPSVERASIVPLLECTFSEQGNHSDSIVVDMEIDSMSGTSAGKSPIASRDLDSTIKQLLLEFGPQPSRESDVNTLTNHIKSQFQEPAPIPTICSNALPLSEVKLESSPGVKVKTFDEQKFLKTEISPRSVSTFSLDGSQNSIGKLDKAASGRVADKYLQIFNTGIKKDPR